MQETMVLGLWLAVLSHEVLKTCHRTNSSERKVSLVSKRHSQIVEVDVKV
jgi:hypothetical protein